MTAPQEPLTLTLGQRVRFNDSIFRAVESRPHPALSTRTERYKVWRRYATTYGGAKSGEGIVVGTRTLTDGHSPYVDDEVGFTYRPEKSHGAVVIATALRRKPVLAFLEDVEPVARDDAAELRARVAELESINFSLSEDSALVANENIGLRAALEAMVSVFHPRNSPGPDMHAEAAVHELARAALAATEGEA